MIRSLAKSSVDRDQPTPGESPPVRLEISDEAVTEVIEAWRERARYLPDEILSDPAWGMLLELLHAEVQDRPVSLSHACKASGVSTSIAVRWIKALESRDLVVRRSHSSGEASVELTPNGSSALRRYFRDVVQSRLS